MHIAFIKGERVNPKAMTRKQRIQALTDYLRNKFEKRDEMNAERDLERITGQQK